MNYGGNGRSNAHPLREAAPTSEPEAKRQQMAWTAISVKAHFMDFGVGRQAGLRLEAAERVAGAAERLRRCGWLSTTVCGSWLRQLPCTGSGGARGPPGGGRPALGAPGGCAAVEAYSALLARAWPDDAGA